MGQPRYEEKRHQRRQPDDRDRHVVSEITDGGIGGNAIGKRHQAVEFDLVGERQEDESRRQTRYQREDRRHPQRSRQQQQQKEARDGERRVEAQAHRQTGAQAGREPGLAGGGGAPGQRPRRQGVGGEDEERRRKMGIGRVRVLPGKGRQRVDGGRQIAEARAIEELTGELENEDGDGEKRQRVEDQQPLVAEGEVER